MRASASSTLALLALAAASLLSTVMVLSVPMDQTNFHQSTHWEGMGWTVALRFSPNSNDVFAAEKTGRIRWYRDINKAADDYKELTQIPAHHFDDRGLMSLAIHPQFPKVPYLFVIFTDGYRKGGSFPFDQCPKNEFVDPQGFKRCSATQRLVRLKVDVENRTLVKRNELLSGWCTVGTSHSVGDMVWSRDGSLLLSAGDGSVYQNGADAGFPGDGCFEDSGPKFQGAFRAQYDQYLNGKLIAISPRALMNGKRLKRDQDYRILAKGLRNPFRMGVQPTTGDVFIADVGSSTAEEINRLRDPVAAINSPHPSNFGWPCLEGSNWSPEYSTNPSYVSTCNKLGANGVIPPFFEYFHGREMPVPNSQLCSAGSASPTGIAFYPDGGSFGSKFSNTMFMLEGSKRCVFFFEKLPGSNEPDPSKLRIFAFTPSAGAGQQKPGQVVDIAFDRAGSMYLVDVFTSTIQVVKRI